MKQQIADNESPKQTSGTNGKLSFCVCFSGREDLKSMSKWGGLPLFLERLNILCWTESCLRLKFAVVYKGSTRFCRNSGVEKWCKRHQVLIISAEFVSARTKMISIPIFRLGWFREQRSRIQLIRFHQHPTPANYFLFLLLCCRWEPDGSGGWVLSECFHYLKCQIILRVAHVLVLNWTCGILRAIK